MLICFGFNFFFSVFNKFSVFFLLYTSLLNWFCKKEEEKLVKFKSNFSCVCVFATYSICHFLCAKCKYVKTFSSWIWNFKGWLLHQKVIVSKVFGSNIMKNVRDKEKHETKHKQYWRRKTISIDEIETTPYILLFLVFFKKNKIWIYQHYY